MKGEETYHQEVRRLEEEIQSYKLKIDSASHGLQYLRDEEKEIESRLADIGSRHSRAQERLTAL